jgi:hypothetical protein
MELRCGSWWHHKERERESWSCVAAAGGITKHGRAGPRNTQHVNTQPPGSRTLTSGLIASTVLPMVESDTPLKSDARTPLTASTTVPAATLSASPAVSCVASVFHAVSDTTRDLHSGDRFLMVSVSWASKGCAFSVQTRWGYIG